MTWESNKSYADLMSKESDAQVASQEPEEERSGKPGEQLLEVFAIAGDVWPKQSLAPKTRGDWLFLGSFVLYAPALGFLVAVSVDQRPVWVQYVTAALLLLSTCLGVGGLVLQTVSGALTIRNRKQVKKKWLLAQAERELGALDELRGYPLEILELAADRLAVEEQQLKERFGVIVGSVGKLGMFAAIAPLAVAIAKVIGADHSDASIAWFWAAVIVLPIFVIIALLVSTRQDVRIQRWLIDRARGAEGHIQVGDDGADGAESGD